MPSLCVSYRRGDIAFYLGAHGLLAGWGPAPAQGAVGAEACAASSLGGADCGEGSVSPTPGHDPVLPLRQDCEGAESVLALSASPLPAPRIRWVPCNLAIPALHPFSLLLRKSLDLVLLKPGLQLGSQGCRAGPVASSCVTVLSCGLETGAGGDALRTLLCVQWQVRAQTVGLRVSRYVNLGTPWPCWGQEFPLFDVGMMKVPPHRRGW